MDDIKPDQNQSAGNVRVRKPTLDRSDGDEGANDSGELDDCKSLSAHRTMCGGGDAAAAAAAAAAAVRLAIFQFVRSIPQRDPAALIWRCPSPTVPRTTPEIADM